MEDVSVRAPGRRVLNVVVVAVAVVLQLILLVPFTVGSGLLAPLWGVAAAYLLWLAAAAALVAAVRRKPLVAPLVPIANAVLLWLLMTAGDVWLGWTA